MVQLVRVLTVHQKVVGFMPCQGIHLTEDSIPVGVHLEGNELIFSLTLMFLSLFLSLSLSPYLSP